MHAKAASHCSNGRCELLGIKISAPASSAVNQINTASDRVLTLISFIRLAMVPPSLFGSKNDPTLVRRGMLRTIVNLVSKAASLKTLEVRRLFLSPKRAHVPTRYADYAVREAR